MEVDTQDVEDEDMEMVLEEGDEDSGKDSDDDAEIEETPVADSQVEGADIPCSQFQPGVEIPGSSEQELPEVEIPGSPEPKDLFGSPEPKLEAKTPSVLEDIPPTQPDTPKPSESASRAIDKTAIVMVSDTEDSPMKGTVSDTHAKEKIALYEEKLSQLKSQLAASKKKSTAQKLFYALETFSKFTVYACKLLHLLQWLALYISCLLFLSVSNSNSFCWLMLHPH